MNDIVKIALDGFLTYAEKNCIEFYNEFCLQHELGIYLRKSLKNYKIDFERNISFFEISSMVKDEKFVKKEIDIVIYNKDKTEKYAIELKAPHNGQYPEQMYSFIKDIKFMEQLKASGFKEAHAMILIDKGFYMGNKKDGIYKYFRNQCTIEKEIHKPTGSNKKIESIKLEGTYKIQWQDYRNTEKYCIIEAQSTAVNPSKKRTPRRS
jgi:hypothetical protein